VRHKAVYADVLKHAFAFIRRVVLAYPGADRATYSVPCYIPGLPLYDRVVAAAWVASQLRAVGYVVQRRDACVDISWPDCDEAAPDSHDADAAAAAAAPTVAQHSGRRVLFM